MNNKLLILVIALVVLVLIIIFPPGRAFKQSIIRQDQEIRTQDNVDQNQAVEAIEKNLRE